MVRDGDGDGDGDECTCLAFCRLLLAGCEGQIATLPPLSDYFGLGFGLCAGVGVVGGLVGGCGGDGAAWCYCLFIDCILAVHSIHSIQKR